MSEVVHRIDAPLVSRVVMGRVDDSVDDRVSHVDVRARHVDLCSEADLSVSKLACSHLLKEREVLLNRSVPVRALLSRLCKRAPVFSYLIRSELAYESLALLDEFDCSVIHRVEIVGSPELLVPLESEPVDVSLDGLDEFDVLFCRVGVIVSEIAAAAVLERGAEIEAKRLGVTDVQVAVRLRRESCHYLFMLARGQIFIDDVMDEVACHVFVFFCCCKCHINTSGSLFQKSFIL